MIDMAGKQIIPAVVRYTTQLANSLNSVRTACPEADVSVQAGLLMETSGLLSDMKTALAALVDVADECASMDAGSGQAHAYHDRVVPAMARLASRESGMNEHITKPLDLGLLMSRLRYWLERA